MGSMSGSGSASGSKSSAHSYMSSLAKTQEKILKTREEFFQDYFIPQFKQVYNSYAPDSEASQAQMGLTANQINNSFNAAKQQTDQQLAQRNLLNSGAGMALTAQNNRARSSALANAYANQTAQSNDKKATMLANLQTLMPATTTAAPVLSQSSSSSWGASGSLSASLGM